MMRAVPTSAPADSTAALRSMVERGIAELRAAGFIVATDPPDRSQRPDDDRFFDIFVTADAETLLNSRRHIAATDPGCAFVLVAGSPATETLQRRAIREADIVVSNARARASIQSIPLRTVVVDLPTTAEGWLRVAKWALDRRAAACRLLPRQPFLGRALPAPTSESSTPS